jgi:hypothetical protein
MKDIHLKPIKPPRVFMGLKEVAGHYSSLKKGFEELGIPSTFISLQKHRFAYGGDDCKWVVRAIRWAGKPGTPKIFCSLKAPLMSMLFFWALFKHDVFIFSFKTSFFKNYRDLPILKAFGKKIIYQFHGSDSRPPYINGSVMAANKNTSIDECIKIAQRNKADLRLINQYADVIIDTPQQGLFHERAFVLWLLVGLPNQCDPGLYELPRNKSNGKLRILHCPSDLEAKGTPVIRKTIAWLIEEGLPIELIEVTGQKNHIVMSELKACDIVVDQLYADYGMPGFATEAAWFGKPVIIGGYAKLEWDTLLPEELRPPTLYCHPDELASAIRYLVENKDARDALGQKAKQFVETYWRPHQVAQRYLDLAYGRLPAEWLYDPANIRYWQGCCFPEKKVREMLRQVIEQGGVSALQLDDKPELVKIMQQEAYC